MSQILDDEDFWLEVRKTIMKAVAPIFREAFLEGAELATEAKPRRRRKQELPIDPDAVNRAADDILAQYQNQWWQRINQTQRDALRAAIIRAQQEGLGPDAVMADIEDLFGPEKARSWAITETTNMIGEGARATYNAAGMTGWRWQTVGDSRVDRLCQGREGEEHPISDEFRAAHPGCRCWPDPVI